MAEVKKQKLSSIQEAINEGKSALYQPIAQYYAINQTGNILISSTVLHEKELREEVVKEFQKVSVLFDGITTAIAHIEDKDPTYKDENEEGIKLGLFNYGKISAMMNNCKFFTLVQEETKVFEQKDTSVTLDLDMISQLVGEYALGGGMSVIMQRVLQSMGSTYGKITAGAKTKSMNDKLGHILFVVEDIMAMPLISIQVLSAELTEIKKVFNFVCGSLNKFEDKVNIKRETFMFVDPEWIQKFAKDFIKHTDDFDTLVNILTDSVSPTEKNEQQEKVEKNEQPEKAEKNEQPEKAEKP